jgi:hypothetical protein
MQAERRGWVTWSKTSVNHPQGWEELVDETKPLLFPSGLFGKRI